ncbi:TPA: hypothetical protein N0F65_009094 [Lagenidium giganteum]|uniref:Peptidase A2 domain-containing protein n=1 Tax=Lagenidium giganteum TaxID=4803 RepID=A0AAV2YLQ9_9STRA|nr:TPA: hypothetical protein N0F65_009094 [Lagenidium giganteum]
MPQPEVGDRDRSIRDAKKKMKTQRKRKPRATQEEARREKKEQPLMEDIVEERVAEVKLQRLPSIPEGVSVNEEESISNESFVVKHAAVVDEAVSRDVVASVRQSSELHTRDELTDKDEDMPDRAPQVFVSGIVEGVGMPLMLDTGASISILHEEVATRLNVVVEESDKPLIFAGISEGRHQASGMATVNVWHK